MKKIIALIIMTTALFAACSGGRKPPRDFLAAKVQALVPEHTGSTQTTLQQFNVTVGEIANRFLREGGAWSKLSDDEWMVTMSPTNEDMKKETFQLVFERKTDSKGDVLLKRMIVDGVDAEQMELASFVYGLQRK